MDILNLIFGKKNLTNDNGLNETYYKKTKILKEKFYKKQGKRHGKYESYFNDGITVNISAFYNDGLLHGECKEWSIAGGCYRYIEVYENGLLKNRKVYFTGMSKPLDTKTNLRELANEIDFSGENIETGYIYEDINRNN
jgi:antitoxin component YwqK of YwqJK toxin-antitoxin module